MKSIIILYIYCCIFTFDTNELSVTSLHAFLHDKFWTPALKVGQCLGPTTTAVQQADCQASVRMLKMEGEKNKSQILETTERFLNIACQIKMKLYRISCFKKFEMTQLI